MKRLFLIILIMFFSSQLFAGWFSKDVKITTSKKADDSISIEIQKGEWSTDPKSELTMYHNENDLTVALGYRGTSEPLKTFKFNSLADMMLFIKSFYPNRKCISERFIDCEDMVKPSIVK